MSRKSVFLSVVALMLISMLVASVGVSYAQGPGGGNGGRGNGPGGPSGGNDGDTGNNSDSDADTPPYGMGNGQMQGYGAGEMPRHMYGYQHGFGYGMNNDGEWNGFRHGFGFGPCLECLPPAVEGELPDDVAAAMMAGLMDEYNAYALYQAVIDQFGEVTPFVNIQVAEAQHIAAHQFLFERYSLDIPEPVVLDPAPVFDTLQDACQMAVEAETANMNLYEEWLDTVQDYPDLVQVFTALRNASQYNHLPAFERCASR